MRSWLLALGLFGLIGQNSLRDPAYRAYWEFERRAHLGQYMGAVRFCEKGGWTDESSRLQFLSRIQAALGQYEQAEETMFKAVAHPERRQFTKEQLAGAEKAQLADPEPIIYAAAKTHRLLCINEAHFMPSHRAYGTKLLAGLRGLGFKYLFLETREPGPLKRMEREKLDRYSSERFGYDPIRKRQMDEAMRLGYKLLALDSMADGPLRPQHMANVVSDLLLKDPNAKVLIWAGYVHVSKTAEAAGHLDAAGLIWRQTKIEPYSVWQCAWDGSDDLCTNLLLADSGHKLTRPMAIMPAGNDPFAAELTHLGVDLLIAYPRMKGDGEHRPDWALDGRHPFPGRTGDKRVALVQAVASGAPRDAVPVDQVVPGSDGRYTLALPTGHYMLRIVDADDRVLHRRHISLR